MHRPRSKSSSDLVWPAKRVFELEQAGVPRKNGGGRGRRAQLQQEERPKVARILRSDPPSQAQISRHT